MADATATTPKIVIKHRYTGAALYEYQPGEDEQASELAIRAALEEAAKGDADLSGADLRGANLRDANLSDGAELIGERPVLVIGPIGSRSDYFTAYLTDKGLRLRAGCFFGTRDDFVEKLDAEHGDNVHGAEYRAALGLIAVHAALWTPKEAE